LFDEITILPDQHPPSTQNRTFLLSSAFSDSIEADRIQANDESTDLATYTADLASMFQSAIERAGMQLVIDCPPLSKPICVDREMWEKIVLNLLPNAFKLIEDLLDISQIMQGKLALTAAPVDLKFVISAAVETVHLAAEAKQIKIQINFNREVASVFGDAARLQQVVWNLLTNAVKFIPSGGQVTVRLEEVRGEGEELCHIPPQAQITVTDTGKGISPDFLPYMFEYFRQADATRKFGSE
jgi:signal transduction histidine kinase